MTKKTPESKSDVNRFFDWIRREPCHFGGIIVDHPTYPKQCQVAWNDQLGVPISEVSHIIRRNSVRRPIDGEKHLGQVVPCCRKHHEWMENLWPEEREKYLEIGQMYFKLYQDEHRDRF